MKEATKNLEGVQGVSASKNHPVVSQGSFMILNCFFLLSMVCGWILLMNQILKMYSPKLYQDQTKLNTFSPIGRVGTY